MKYLDRIKEDHHDHLNIASAKISAEFVDWQILKAELDTKHNIHPQENNKS